MSAKSQEQTQQACIGLLLRHRSVQRGPNDCHFNEDLASVALQESSIRLILPGIIQSLTTNQETPVNVNAWLDAILTFVWYQYWTKPHLKIGKSLLDIAHKIEDFQREADINYCLGQIAFRLDCYADAKAYLQSAITLYDDLERPEEALRAHCSYIQSCFWQGDSTLDPEEYMAETRRRVQELGTREAKARLFYHEGDISWFKSSSSQASDQFKLAKDIFTSLKMPLEAADCQYRLARVHGIAHEFSVALKTAEEAVEAYNNLGVSGRGDGVFAEILKVRYLKGLDIWDERLTSTLHQALEKAQEYDVPLAIAQASEEWAEVHVKRQAWVDARLSYEEALRKSHEVHSETGRYIAHHCEQNLEHIRLRESGVNPPLTFWPPDRY
jgi:tetratricopeptide (TPR) repeat protein